MAVGVKLSRCGDGAVEGVYWFESIERLAEALCFSLPTIFGWDDEDEDDAEEDPDADSEEAQDHTDGTETSASTIDDFDPEDPRVVAFRALVTDYAKTQRVGDSALAAVNELVNGLAQSDVDWIGSFEDLKSGDHEGARALRSDFRDFSTEDSAVSTPDPDAPLAADEVDAFVDWLSDIVNAPSLVRTLRRAPASSHANPSARKCSAFETPHGSSGTAFW